MVPLIRARDNTKKWGGRDPYEKIRSRAIMAIPPMNLQYNVFWHDV